VVGEPGVGKSRLALELMHSPRVEGWLLLEARAVSYGRATSYLPVIELLKGYFRVDERDTRRDIRGKITGRVLALDRALEEALPALLALLDGGEHDAQWQNLEPSLRRQRTIDAVKGLLLREAQVQPLFLLFEDLHWIDSETQTILDRLVEALPSVPMLLLVNYRPEYEHRWGGRASYTQIRLDPLTPAGALGLLEGLLGADPTIETLKGLLIERTDGNPFFLEESVRTLADSKALVGERGAYRLDGPVTDIRIAPTVQAVLAAGSTGSRPRTSACFRRQRWSAATFRIRFSPASSAVATRHCVKGSATYWQPSSSTRRASFRISSMRSSMR
jgi:predicted ATPase